MRPLVVIAVLLASLACAAAAEPWEFEDRLERSRAETEFQRTSLLRAYEQAGEYLKKGGSSNYDEAIRRLRWCVLEDPEPGLKRDRIRRWKKIDYNPYYNLALLFALKGDWPSALRCFERIDPGQIAQSAYSVGYQRFREDAKVVQARLQLLGYVRELDAWFGAGVPVYIERGHADAIARLGEQAARLAKRPAGPYRGGLDEEPAALSGAIASGLMQIYRAELSRRVEAIGQLADPPLSALGAEPPPASECRYEGQDLKVARDRLYRCAGRLWRAVSAVAPTACERLGERAPAWCASGTTPSWNEFAAIAPLLRAPTETAQERPPREVPTERPPPRPRPTPPEPARPEPAEPQPVETEPEIEETPPPEAEMEPSLAPADAREVLRIAYEGLESGRLDRTIARLRALESAGRFPAGPGLAALCRASFAQLLFLKARASVREPGDGPAAGSMLLDEAAAQVARARSEEPGLDLPAALFSTDFRETFAEEAADEIGR